MLFRLINASIIFQAYINKALLGLLDEFYIVYLDNILIFLKLEEKYIDYIK